jgi:acyl-CoA dehydrogenase
MSTADPLLVETVERLLATVCTHEAVEHAEVDGGWSAPAWKALADAGFPWVGIDDAEGGSGGTLFDAAAILRAAGAHAAAVPLGETALVGGWALARAGLALPAGPLAVVETPVAPTDDRLVFTAPVAWAGPAERVVVLTTTGRVVALRPDQVAITSGANLAGEARDHIAVDVALADVETAPVPADVTAAAWRDRGALSRLVMAAGALGAMAQMTVDYTNVRKQFGKPVATFQAVQIHLVTAAQGAVRAQMATDLAVRAVAAGAGHYEVAAARVVVDDAITTGTRAAHQAHGAMGVTREYPLHQLTRRLWAWRHEWGTTSEWRRTVGAQVVADGADRLYDLIAR